MTCRVVHGMTGSSTSAWETSSSISVQPSRIARGAGVPQLLGQLDHAAAGGVDDAAVDELVVDGGVEPRRGARASGMIVVDAVAGEPLGEEAVRHRDRACR